MPTNRELWRVENYHLFLKERHILLADAANWMLETLQSGSLPPMAEPVALPRTDVSPAAGEALGNIDSRDETAILMDLNPGACRRKWVMRFSKKPRVN